MNMREREREKLTSVVLRLYVFLDVFVAKADITHVHPHSAHKISSFLLISD